MNTDESHLSQPFAMPTEHHAAAACPLCGGTTIELRGMLRCLQCQYMICESCESETPAEQ